VSIRVFVIFAVLLIAVVLNGVLIYTEHTPEPRGAKEEYEKVDLFRDMLWTAGTRRSNMQEFMLTPDMVDKVDERLQAYQKRDRKGRILEALKANSDVGGRLCSNVGSLPSRYFAAGILMRGEEGTRKSLVRFDSLMTKIKLSEDFRPINLEGMYDSTELQPNAKPDNFALNIGAILLGQEVERVNKEEDWSDGIFGSRDLQTFINAEPGVEEDMVEFFAMSHYLHEVARDPGNEFCGVRVGAGN